MTDTVKLKYRTAKRWITYVLRLLQYLVLVVGGIYAIVQPPISIVESMGPMIIRVMGAFLLVGAAACFVGWGFGRWEFEQYGSVFAAVGAGLYLWAVILTPDIVSLGGMLRTMLTLYVVVSLITRIFELERYTSIAVIPGRIRLES